VDNRFVNCICLEVAMFVIRSVAKVILRFSVSCSIFLYCTS